MTDTPYEYVPSTGCRCCDEEAERAFLESSGIAARTVTNLWAAVQSPRLILKAAS